MSAGGLTNALLAIGGWLLLATLFGAALGAALKRLGEGKVRASAGTNRAGKRTVGRRLSETNDTQLNTSLRTGQGPL